MSIPTKSTITKLNKKNYKIKMILNTIKRQTPHHIPDDEYAVSIKEAKYIAIQDPIYSVYTILDIVEQFSMLNGKYYYSESLIRLLLIPKKSKLPNKNKLNLTKKKEKEWIPDDEKYPSEQEIKSLNPISLR